MQLDFKSTVENCSSFVSICPSDDLDAFESMQWSDYYLKKFDLTDEVKKKNIFSSSMVFSRIISVFDYTWNALHSQRRQIL